MFMKGMDNLSDMSVCLLLHSFGYKGRFAKKKGADKIKDRIIIWLIRVKPA